MKAFTDEDLKRLQKNMECLSWPLMDQLLNRLECAEAYANNFDPIDEKDVELFSAWRKAAGK